MHEPVEYRVGSGGVFLEDVVPVRDRELRDYDGGFPSVSVLDNLHEVKQLLPVKDLHAEVVEYEQVGLCQPVEEAMQAARHPCQGYLLEEPVEVEVGHLQAVHTCLVPESRGEPAFAGAGGTGDDDRETVPDVVAGGQIEHRLPVQAAGGVEDDLVDGCLVAEAGPLQEPCVAAHRAVVELGLYHHLQAVLQGELAVAAGLLQGLPEVRHPGHLQAFEVGCDFVHNVTFWVGV